MADRGSGEERQALFASMIENSSELALAADTDGRIVYANSAALGAGGWYINSAMTRLVLEAG